MSKCFVVILFLLLPPPPWCQGAENSGLPPYKWPGYPKYNLDLKYQPLKGWQVETVYRGKGSVFLNERGRASHARGVKSKDNPALKGPDENLYFLRFDYSSYQKLGGPAIKEMKQSPTRPVFLGWDYNDFSTRFRRWTGERGFSRKFVIPSEFSGHQAIPLSIPNFHVDRRSPLSDWQRFMMPVVTAEGGGDYTVINSFDRAGMTVGFMQMAAHTPNDMIAMMKHLIQSEELRRDTYANPMRWFPELGITADGKLGYRKGTSIVSLEECTSHRNSNEGFRRPPKGWPYFREDFVRFCNPSVKEINRAELEFAARWLMWSMSPKMRHAQLEPAKNNVVKTLMKLEGVPPRVSAVDASIAAVILHWKDGDEYREIVSRLLKEHCPVTTLLSLEARRGRPGTKSLYGQMLLKGNSWFNASTSDRKILNRRIEAVRLLFERDPKLLARLRTLKFDFRTGTLVR